MTDSSKEYFDAIGGGWDEMQQRFFSTAVREKALSVAAVDSGKVAADIGAGTGFITEGLHERGLKVIAVDQYVPTPRRTSTSGCRRDGESCCATSDAGTDAAISQKFLSI